MALFINIKNYNEMEEEEFFKVMLEEFGLDKDACKTFGLAPHCKALSFKEEQQYELLLKVKEMHKRHMLLYAGRETQAQEIEKETAQLNSLVEKMKATQDECNRIQESINTAIEESKRLYPWKYDENGKCYMDSNDAINRLAYLMSRDDFADKERIRRDFPELFKENGNVIDTFDQMNDRMLTLMAEGVLTEEAVNTKRLVYPAIYWDENGNFLPYEEAMSRARNGY